MPYEERWIWEDPFTVQMLLRDVDENTWSCYRQSKVLEERRLIQERRELDDIRSQKVQDVKLD